MKIAITDSAGIYYVTKTPNWLQKLFGIKERIEKYRLIGEYHYFPGLYIFCKSDGEKLSFDDKITTALNNYLRKF